MGQICDPAELELFYDYAILEKKVRSQDLMVIKWKLSLTFFNHCLVEKYFFLAPLLR